MKTSLPMNASAAGDDAPFPWLAGESARVSAGTRLGELAA